MKPFTVIGLLLAAGLLAAAVYTSRNAGTIQTAPPVSRVQGSARAFHPPPRTELNPDGTPASRPSVRRPPRNVTLARATKAKTVGELPQGQPKPVEEMPDELEPIVPIEIARAALTGVGNDAEAEDVWLEAINDPALSAKERSDLIEDLNEEGFPDPKNITMNDLPLIVNRIALIEEVGPDAMDDVNADAFAEAYKDLKNMLTKLEAEAEELQELDDNDELEPEQQALLHQFQQYQQLHQELRQGSGVP